MPLRTMALGLLLVLVDVRLDGVDVVPDVIGWVIVAVAVRRLGAGDPIVSLLVRTTAVVGVLSLGDLVRVPIVGPVYDVGVSAVLVLLANYLAVRAARVDDVPAERWWLRLRNAVLVLTALSLALSVFAGKGPLTQLFIVAVIATLVTTVVFTVLLYLHARRPWATNES